MNSNDIMIEQFGKIIDDGIAEMVLSPLHNFMLNELVKSLKNNPDEDFQERLDKISELIKNEGFVKQNIHLRRQLAYTCEQLKKAIKLCGYDGLLELRQTNEFEAGSFSRKKAMEVAIKYNIELQGLLAIEIKKVEEKLSDLNQKSSRGGRKI